MNPRRHLIARGYAAIVVTLRHLIPLAWIAAVVWATIALPDLASAPTAPLEDLAAKNGAASQAAATATKRFGFPLATQTAVVQRNAKGLPSATQRRTLLAARGVFTHSGGVPSDIKAALPIFELGARRPRRRARHDRDHVPVLPAVAVARHDDGRRATSTRTGRSAGRAGRSSA